MPSRVMIVVVAALLAGACTKSGNSGSNGNGGITGPSAITPPPPTTTTTSMRWTLINACNNGRGLQARFFDKTNNLVWPPDSSKVYVTGAGGTIDVSLAATAGAKICYGAQPDPPNNSHWGIGINGDQGCTDCCYTGANTTVQLNLSCQ